MGAADDLSHLFIGSNGLTVYPRDDVPDHYPAFRCGAAVADFLQPYDHIVVRMTPNFATDRVVEINGRVRYPGVYVMEDNRTQLSQIIEMAGGLLDDANPSPLFSVHTTTGAI